MPSDTMWRPWHCWPSPDIARLAGKPNMSTVRMGIRDRFRAAFGWDWAHVLSSRGRYEEALRLIQSINAAPTGPRDYWSLFEIYQLSLLGRHVETLRSALTFVDRYAAKQGLSANDRYFVSFAKWAGGEAFHQLFPVTAPPAQLEQDFSEYRLSDVRSRWKRTFPMRIHPNWVEPARMTIFGPRPTEI